MTVVAAFFASGLMYLGLVRTLNSRNPGLLHFSAVLFPQFDAVEIIRVVSSRHHQRSIDMVADLRHVPCLLSKAMIADNECQQMKISESFH